MKRSEKHLNTLDCWTDAGLYSEPFEEIATREIQRVARPVRIVVKDGARRVARPSAPMSEREASPDPSVQRKDLHSVAAVSPALHPETLGDSGFKRLLNLKYAYVVGAMANGITSVEMVEAAGRAGMVGFFGAAGLPLDEIERAAHQLKQRMDGLPYGFNLIHSPNDPALELETVRLYLSQGIERVSASAYMDLTVPLVYYRIKGIHRDRSGSVICPNTVIGKISREEVARKFFSPAPQKIISQLLESNLITREEAALSSEVPVAQVLTAEADSGGHTDNRPALTLLPTLMATRDQLAEKHGFKMPLFVGLGGGIATPDAAAAAFSMGAAYILTGSVNQACMESGTSDAVRRMLAEAGQADIAMAPAADMFEMGVKVQVLKRGTMFPLRAAKLYDLYSRYNAFESIPENQRNILEKEFFHRSFEAQWSQTRLFFEKRDPSQIQRAQSDPKHKMALVFRSYLGQASNWANAGVPSRQLDYQIWCGPAMGAFNAWTKDTFLENPQNRKTVLVAMNLLLGAATITRAAVLKHQGIPLPPGADRFTPKTMTEIEVLLRHND